VVRGSDVQMGWSLSSKGRGLQLVPMGVAFMAGSGKREVVHPGRKVSTTVVESEKQRLLQRVVRGLRETASTASRWAQLVVQEETRSMMADGGRRGVRTTTSRERLRSTRVLQRTKSILTDIEQHGGNALYLHGGG
jgi:hypothetical protein